MGQFIGAASAATNTVSMPSHVPGDMLVAVVARNSADATISVPAGWTNISAVQVDIGGFIIYRVLYRVATTSGTSTGTFTNANYISVAVYRGFTGFYAGSAGGGSSSTIAYPSRAIGSDAYWYIRTAYHANNTNLTTNTPSGYISRTSTSNRLRLIDSGTHTTTAASSQNQSVNGSGTWFSATIAFSSQRSEGSPMVFFSP